MSEELKQPTTCPKCGASREPDYEMCDALTGGESYVCGMRIFSDGTIRISGEIACLTRQLAAAQARIAELERGIVDPENGVVHTAQSSVGWMEDARRYSRNEEYLRGLLHRIAAPFGIAAKTSDDGSVQQDVICVLVPELVEKRIAELEGVVAAHGIAMVKSKKRIAELSANQCEKEPALTQKIYDTTGEKTVIRYQVLYRKTK